MERRPGLNFACGPDFGVILFFGFIFTAHVEFIWILDEYLLVVLVAMCGGGRAWRHFCIILVVIIHPFCQPDAPLTAIACYGVCLRQFQGLMALDARYEALRDNKIVEEGGVNQLHFFLLLDHGRCRLSGLFYCPLAHCYDLISR